MLLWKERKLKEIRKGKKGTTPAALEITVEETMDSHGSSSFPFQPLTLAGRAKKT